jgi:hypothetical protein
MFFTGQPFFGERHTDLQGADGIDAVIELEHVLSLRRRSLKDGQAGYDLSL